MNGGSFSEDSQENPNSAILLNGIDDFVDLSVFAETFRENLDQMTIFFKIRFVEEGDDQTILSLGNHGENLMTNVFEVEYEHNRLQVETETESSAINHEFEIDQTEPLFTSEWHQIYITLNGDSLSYCRDGKLIFKGIYIPSQTTSNNLFVGCFGGLGPNPCCFFGGLIDDLQFYNRILDEALCCSQDEKYEIPNVFTPNADQQNDTFYIFSKGETEVVEFKIYSRWGNLVHNSTKPWDGTFNGQPVPSDIYIYVINIKTGCKTKRLQGDVSLLR
jgi:gliding motility-associated-like protein